MPVLYERLGIPGRILSSLFFLCLSLGGVSSLVAMIELPVHTLEEMRGALICYSLKADTLRDMLRIHKTGTAPFVCTHRYKTHAAGTARRMIQTKLILVHFCVVARSWGQFARAGHSMRY